jgi:hypothetical protein
MHPRRLDCSGRRAVSVCYRSMKGARPGGLQTESESRACRDANIDLGIAVIIDLARAQEPRQDIAEVPLQI